MSTHHHQIKWRHLESVGLELVRVDFTPSLIDVEGRVIGQQGGQDFALDYSLELDADWRLLRAEMRLLDGHCLVLRRSDAGHWLNGYGLNMPVLHDATDIDIFATPFTNSLPLNRVKPAEGEAAEVSVIYIADLELVPTKAVQTYKHVGPGKYEYQSLTTGYQTEFEVDEYNYVLTYPGLFERV